MSQKLTLAVYLQSRGEVKSLTRIEAEAFGVPYPLVSGWPARHGNAEISATMLEDLAQRIAGARRSTAGKAMRGLDGAGAFTRLPFDGACMQRRVVSTEPVATFRNDELRSFPGLALRPAKRFRARSTRQT